MPNNDNDHRGFRAKVPNPYTLDEKSVTLIILRKWFNILETYNQQNDEFLLFYTGGEHDTWSAKSTDPTRGITVAARAAAGNIAAINDADAAQMTRTRRRDLNALLNNYANYVPENYYELILDEATSIQWIFDKLAESLSLQTTKQYFLNSYNITYQPDQGDTPEKLYMRLRGHYQQAAPKRGSMFNGNQLQQDEKIGPLVEMMLVEKTFEKIDPRLPAHILKTKGHLMEDGQQTLYCVRRLLWNQVPTMLAELDQQNGDDASANFVSFSQGRGRGRARDTRPKTGQPRQNRSFRFNNFGSSNSSSTRDGGSRRDGKVQGEGPPAEQICGSCFRAGKPQSVYMSHNYENCNSLSTRDKQRLVKAAVRFIDEADQNDAEKSDQDYDEETANNTDYNQES